VTSAAGGVDTGVAVCTRPVHIGPNLNERFAVLDIAAGAKSGGRDGATIVREVHKKY